MNGELAARAVHLARRVVRRVDRELWLLELRQQCSALERRAVELKTNPPISYFGPEVRA